LGAKRQRRDAHATPRAAKMGKCRIAAQIGGGPIPVAARELSIHRNGTDLAIAGLWQTQG
jgi:hypothetical protein